MNFRNFHWRKIAIEPYLILVALTFAFGELWWSGMPMIAVSKFIGRSFFFFYLFGGDFFLLAILLVELYMATSLIYFLLRTWLDEGIVGIRSAARRFWGMIGELLLLMVSLGVALTVLGMMTGILDNTWVFSKIVSISGMLAGVDFRITGVVPMVWLGNVTPRLLGIVFFVAYDILAPLMSLLLLYALIRKPALARRFLIFFLVSQVLALPMWLLAPALSPYQYYTGGLSISSAPAPVANQLSGYHPSALASDLFRDAAARQAAIGVNYRDLTTFPSMHAAWGFGLVYFSVMAFGTAAAYFLVPWFLLELLGAVYSGEHYVVDLIAGIAVALISLWMTNWLLKLHDRYYTGPKSFKIFAMMYDDMARVSLFIKECAAWVKTLVLKVFSK